MNSGTSLAAPRRHSGGIEIPSSILRTGDTVLPEALVNVRVQGSRLRV